MPEQSTQNASWHIKVIRIIGKAVAFLLLFALLFTLATDLLIDHYTVRIHEFYKEERDSLDAVFIGSSNTYQFWSPLHAWRTHGIATSCFAASSQTLLSYRYMVEEAAKTQPHAVFVIALSSPVVASSREYFHYLTNVMPFSLTKLRMILAYSRYQKVSLGEAAEYLFPIIRYHERWDSISPSDFSKKQAFTLKEPNIYDTYRKASTDVSAQYRSTDERLPIREDAENVLNDLLEYCGKEGLSVLFVRVPQSERPVEEIAETSTMFDIIREHGFPVLDMQDMTREIGLDLSHDYYDKYHTNIHGSLKYTDFVAEYLSEHYDMTSKRDDPAYASFDKALEEYLPYIDSFLLPFETDGTSRDFSLDAPTGLKAVRQKDGSVLLSWKKAEGSTADEYEIFRRSFREESKWIFIGRVGADETGFSDNNLRDMHTYSYTVVPCREQDGLTIYGNADYNGVSVAARKK